MSDVQYAETRRPRLLKLTVQEYDKDLTPRERGLARAIAHEMGREYAKKVRSYQKILNLTNPDDPIREKLTPAYIHEEALGANIPSLITQLRGKPMSEMSWSDFQNATATDPQETLKLWQAMLHAANDYIAAGAVTAEAIGVSSPWRRAQFSAIRDGFIEEWKPRGGIELALVDILVQSYFGYQHWLSTSFLITRYEHTMIEDKIQQGEEWRPPRQSYAEMLEHATQMADRFNRMFLRTLRQMRDLRRYASPEVIQNAGQVNVAAEGGQQVNVHKIKKERKNLVR